MSRKGMLALLILVLAQCKEAGAERERELPVGPPHSPLSFSGMSTRSRSDEDIALTARLLGGGSTANVQVGSYEDKTPFGDVNIVNDATAIEGIVLVRSPDGKTSQSVPVTLVIKEERVVSVFTAARDKWIEPCAELYPRDVEKEACSAVVESLKPLLSVPSSSVAQVLETLWKYGIAPDDAGQIILRPRTVMTVWPWEPGPIGPRPGPATKRPFWICHALGRIAHEESDGSGYLTQNVAFIHDLGLEVVCGAYIR